MDLTVLSDFPVVATVLFSVCVRLVFFEEVADYKYISLLNCSLEVQWRLQDIHQSVFAEMALNGFHRSRRFQI